MISYQSLFSHPHDDALQPWIDIMPAQINAGLDVSRYGNLQQWIKALELLPVCDPGNISFSSSAITTGGGVSLSSEEKALALKGLKQLMPWRKGPYNLHGIEIDTEWRSDWKWDRLEQYIQPLAGRSVLDVGCGNGYHGWRMLAAGANLVIGVDPSPLFVMQYQAVKHFTGEQPMYVLPMAMEDVPENLQAFDTVFSMGVLYHRRSPIEHLMQLKKCLKSGGELVLETLVIDGDDRQVLLPKDRYAKMRNVWFIGSAAATQAWLVRCGFLDVQCVDVNVTTVKEQRSTEWMPFESLADFLNEKDQSKTIEGYQAPTRAVFTATAP